MPYDVRKAHPYLKYDEVDFDVPVGTDGDNFDRFIVRLAEIRQSARIIEQCCERMPDDGPGQRRRPAHHPARRRTRSTRTIEGTIQHFKIIMEGIKVPAGEVLLVHRGRQRRARLLPRLRRQRHALPRAHPPAVLPDHGGPRAHHHRRR